jgi:hypothetical protein
VKIVKMSDHYAMIEDFCLVGVITYTAPHWSVRLLEGTISDAAISRPMPLALALETAKKWRPL